LFHFRFHSLNGFLFDLAGILIFFAASKLSEFCRIYLLFKHSDQSFPHSGLIFIEGFESSHRLLRCCVERLLTLERVAVGRWSLLDGRYRLK